ncbi:MAG: thioesterase, partial [Alloprevotella sp.]|nr:thioesterase [Alloprevotella sp.]
PYGHAFSTWALINLDSREPVDLTDSRMAGLSDVCTERPLPIAPPGRLRLTQPEALGETVACYTDLDINGHVNSIRYIEMMLDRLKDHDFAAQPVRRIEVAYSAEAYRGDRLTFYRQTATDGRQLMEIRRDDTLPVVKAAIAF